MPMAHVEGARRVKRVVQPVSRNAARPAAPLVVELAPEGLVVWEKGRRKKELLPWGMAYLVAVRLRVDQERREKAAARKLAKAARKLQR